MSLGGGDLLLPGSQHLVERVSADGCPGRENKGSGYPHSLVRTAAGLGLFCLAEVWAGPFVPLGKPVTLYPRRVQQEEQPPTSLRSLLCPCSVPYPCPAPCHPLPVLFTPGTHLMHLIHSSFSSGVGAEMRYTVWFPSTTRPSASVLQALITWSLLSGM